jgi:tight adherence protein C
MTPLWIAMLSFAAIAGIMVVTGWLLLQRMPAVGKERLNPQGVQHADSSILRWSHDIAPRWQRVATRLGEAIGPGDATRRSQYRKKLVVAGFADPRAVTMFMGAKVGVAILAAAAYPLYGLMLARVLPNMFLVPVALGAIGFFIPDSWLARTVRHRQQRIIQALPDVLDLLMVCVEAGMGFDAAVARISDKALGKSPLHDELMRMHLEIRASRSREDALRDLGDRTGVEEVRRLVTAFIQADRLGTPLGKTLRIHAETARVERRHRAEERAYLAPLKMIFPTAIFLLPAFMLVAMAPSLLNLMKLFEAIGGEN